MSPLFTSIGPLEGALDYHMQRHNVLSSNVAHVDTPGYRPHDLARTSGFDHAFAAAMRRTAPLHLRGPSGMDAALAGRVFTDISAGAGNDGNYVSLDREAAKLAANHLRYDVVSAIVSAELGQLRFAVSEGRG